MRPRAAPETYPLAPRRPLGSRCLPGPRGARASAPLATPQVREQSPRLDTYGCSLWYLRLQVRGLDYAAVLDMVIGAARPVTIHFERRGAKPPGVLPVRTPHQEWTSPPAAEPATAGAQE